ncbi:5-hydroxytryptamine receptor 5B-like [Molossus nigricans]
MDSFSRLSQEAYIGMESGRLSLGPVASMAVPDVLVTALVTPPSLVSELSHGRHWLLGRSPCHVWVSNDVLCCTASIWNVRPSPWTITSRRQAAHAAHPPLITLTWALALSAPALLLVGSAGGHASGRQRCRLSQDPPRDFSTCSAFYLPLGVVLFVSWKIYTAARKAVQPVPDTVQRFVVLLIYALIGCFSSVP